MNALSLSEREAIDAAIAAGKVTRCPPRYAHTVQGGEAFGDCASIGANQPSLRDPVSRDRSFKAMLAQRARAAASKPTGTAADGPRIRGSRAKMSPDDRKAFRSARARAIAGAARAAVQAKKHARWDALGKAFDAAPTLETVVRLAEQEGCSVRQVRDLLRSAGRNPPLVGPPPAAIVARDADLVTTHAMGASVAALARDVGLCVRTVSRIVSGAGGEAPRKSRQPGEPSVIDREIAAFYLAGNGSIACADRFGCSQTKVQYAVARCGGKMRRKGGNVPFAGRTTADVTAPADAEA